MRTRLALFARFFLGFSVVILFVPGVRSQDGAATAQPTTSEIVQRLVAENQQRSQKLGVYTSRRHYHVAYHGFPHAAEADMVVDAVCNGPGSKQFDVISESGSHVLVDHVLKKLLRAEQDDSHHRSDSALTPANYTFTLLRTEIDGGRPVYVLTVEPKQSHGLLYRGTIWVDAQDYAVVKLNAEPAKSPSFWIRNVQINRQYEKAGDFWLPRSDRSETKVRLGGVATLTIDYDDYRFVSTEAIDSPAWQVPAAP